MLCAAGGEKFCIPSVVFDFSQLICGQNPYISDEINVDYCTFRPTSQTTILQKSPLSHTFFETPPPPHVYSAEDVFQE